MKIPFLVLHLMVGLSFQSCEEGVTKTDGCVPEKCTGGKWIPAADTFLQKCRKCTAEGDPHFTNFNGAKFSWHDGCNYVLVQEGASMNPKFGVFVDFHRVDTIAYVGGTTYQDSPDTKVVLFPLEKSTLFNVEVNGIKQQITQDTPTLLPGTSVYAWNHLSCVRLYGNTQLLVELCVKMIHIWAPPHVTYGGLCGSTNGPIESTLLVARDGEMHDHKQDQKGDWLKLPQLKFGCSWKAREQTKNICQGAGNCTEASRRKRDIEIHTICFHYATTSTSGEHHEKCLAVHLDGVWGIGDDHHGMCKYDLCWTTYGPEHNRDNLTTAIMLDHHNQIHARRIVHHHSTIAHFSCIDDGFYVDPGQCDKYYHCSRGKYTEKLCPDGLIFDDTLGPRVEQCSYPFQVECPEGKVQQFADAAGVECPRQNGRFEHEDPTNCEEYYECVNGISTLRKCHKGLFFDEFMGVCDWATKGFRSGCVDRLEVLADGFSCAQNRIQSQAGVPDRDHVLYIHPEDCRSYYICYDQIQPALSSCPEGTVFNEFTFNCDDPLNVPGCEDYYAGR